MTPDRLRLQFASDGDGTGELYAEVHCREFAGVSSAWFSEQQLVAFAGRLAAAYPLPKDAPLTLKGGIWNKAGTEIEQLHVGLEFYPIGSIGQVGCRVVLNTGDREAERPKSQSSVAVELKTTYSRIEAFGPDYFREDRPPLDDEFDYCMDELPSSEIEKMLEIVGGHPGVIAANIIEISPDHKHLRAKLSDMKIKDDLKILMRNIAPKAHRNRHNIKRNNG